MLERKAIILFVISGFSTILGFICGVGPGVVLKNYVLLGIGSGLLLLIFILLIITMVTYEYGGRNRVFSTPRTYNDFFDNRLSRKEKVLFIFTSFLLLTGGILLGVLCELLLKAISASFSVQLIVGAICIFTILVLLIIILYLRVHDSETSKIYDTEPIQVLPESNTHSQVLIEPQDEPRNTVSRTNHYRSRYFDDDSNNAIIDPSFNDSMTYPTNNFNNPKSPSIVQREYQKLLRPSPRFYLNEKVYVNETDVARIVETDGEGNYRVQHLGNGLIDFKNGTELRKALPWIK